MSPSELFNLPKQITQPRQWSLKVIAVEEIALYFHCLIDWDRLMSKEAVNVKGIGMYS